MRFSKPVLERDVIRFIEAKKKWNNFLKWENYTFGMIGNKKKKEKLYSEYIKAMKKLEKKYNPNYNNNFIEPLVNN